MEKDKLLRSGDYTTKLSKIIPTEKLEHCIEAYQAITKMERYCKNLLDFPVDELTKIFKLLGKLQRTGFLGERDSNDIKLKLEDSVYMRYLPRYGNVNRKRENVILS